MSTASIAERQAMEASVSRAASRADSISSLWSSAEVPLCLDPRVQPSSDGLDMYTSRRYSIAASISRNSARSSQSSMDFGRLSIDIPDDYPRRPDSIRLSPPRASGSASSSGSSPCRVHSFNIGTIDEDEPMLSSSVSNYPYQPPSLFAQQRVLSSRFSEDTIDEPPLLHSASQATFSTCLSVPRKSSGLTEVSRDDSLRSPSVQDTDLFAGVQMQDTSQAPKDLYRRAYRFFDKEYTVKPTLHANALATSSSADACFMHGQRFGRPSLVGSELSHEDSLCERSQASTLASCSDLASSWSAEGSLQRAHIGGPIFVSANAKTSGPYLTAGDDDITLTPKGQRAACRNIDSLSIPSFPSLPSFNSTLTASYADPSREIRRRPSTADVYSHAARITPHALPNLPLPPPLPTPPPTEPVRYEVQSYPMAPAASPTSKRAGSKGGDGSNRSTTSRLLRARFASTPKLRLDSGSLFPSQQALHAQHPVPPLPGRLGNASADRRPSTAQMDGRAPFLFGRRFRSRTLGESDRTEADNMQTSVVASRGVASPASAPRYTKASGLCATETPLTAAHRHPSFVSATSSEFHSPLSCVQPTPGSSICSANSPVTTNSSLPVTPRTSAFPRPKSRGTGSTVKAGGAGWASYLNSGLTLHLEGEHGRVCQINMSYLAYDPFGRPEQLVEGTEAACSLTPRRPKSRSDKNQEAEQSGTLEFGLSDDVRTDAFTFDVSRKSDGSALLKHLTVGEDTKADLLTRQAALSLNTLGSHQVSGYERKGRLAWKFAYRVEQDGGSRGVKRLVPLRFSCSATLLNPERARKSRLLNLVKKQMVPTLASRVVVMGSSFGSPRSALCQHEDGLGTRTVSPASSRRSNRQPVADNQQLTSPIRRGNGTATAGGANTYNSPLRQASHTTTSVSSITSAESSTCSKPTTSSRDHANTDPSLARLHLQASPVSAQFGQPTPAQRHLRPLGSVTAAVAPALQLDLGSSQKLQEKASKNSLSASSVSSGSVQLAKPMVINGRKLIPISLPAGLARKSRIDPALLQANVVRSPVSFKETEATERGTSMQSSSSSSGEGQKRVVDRDASANKCLLSSQPRMGVSSSSRPPTASETIKLEYLARNASDEILEAKQQLRHHKSFAGAILTPSSFADGDRQKRRQRSKTVEEGRQRPFTADAWGVSQYPSREQVFSARALGGKQQRPETGDRGYSFGSSTDGYGCSRRHHLAQEVSSSAWGEGGIEMGYKPLPAPPRPNSRPRTAQTPTSGGYQIGVRAVQGARC